MSGLINIGVTNVGLPPVMAIRSAASVNKFDNPVKKLLGEINALKQVNQAAGRLAGSLATGDMQEPAALAAAIARIEETEAVRGACIKRIARSMAQMPPPSAAPQPPTAKSDVFEHSADSSWKLSREVVGEITKTSDNYLRLRADISKAYTDYYKDLSEVNAEVAKAISTGASEWVKFDRKAVLKKIDEVKNKWDAGLVVKEEVTAEGTTITSSRFKGLGVVSELPFNLGDLVAEYGNGFFVKDSGGALRVDTSILQKIHDAIVKLDVKDDTGDKNNGIQNVEFNPWKSIFEGQLQEVQTQMRQTAERYSHANSRFDNLTNILLKIIDALYKTDQLYLT